MESVINTIVCILLQLTVKFQRGTQAHAGLTYGSACNLQNLLIATIPYLLIATIPAPWALNSEYLMIPLLNIESMEAQGQPVEAKLL